MCLLILIQGLDASYPILVASNRDEARERKASPPGLYVGERMRILSPRDRQAGGTWMGVNGKGLFAGITNVASAKDETVETSRGTLPHLALDQPDLEHACRAVREAVAGERFNAFQLLVSDGREASVLVHVEAVFTETRTTEQVLILSNEHRLGELDLPGVQPALAANLSVEERLGLLKPVLLDEGGEGRHRILKKGGAYGTVSSSLLAVPGSDPKNLVWWYAPESPDSTEYRNYGNLGRRLLG